MTDSSTASYTIDLIPGTQIALFRWIGPITLEDRRANREIIRDFCIANGANSVLIDGREQESKTTTMESFNFGTEVPAGFRGLRLAVVHRPDDDSLQFIEAVAGNRGSSTRAFEDFEEALAWLKAADNNADSSG